MLLTYIIAFIVGILPKHDVPVASYNLYVSDFEVKLELELHTDDLKKIKKLDKKNLSGNKIINYLNENSIWKFNNSRATLEFCELKKDQFHTLVTAHIFTNQKIKSIEILNRSFVDEIRDFGNVYYIYQKEKEVRGFRSHIKRKLIKINL